MYLPAGDWYDFWTNAEYCGGRTILADAPLDHLPLFVKAGTLLPWQAEIGTHVKMEPEQAITFKAFGERTRWTHYQDNGSDFRYQQGEFNLYDLWTANGNAHIELTKHGFQPCYQRINVELATNKQAFQLSDDHYEPQDD